MSNMQSNRGVFQRPARALTGVVMAMGLALGVAACNDGGGEGADPATQAPTDSRVMLERAADGASHSG